MHYKFINSEYLDSVSAGDPEIIREIVDMFSEQVIEMYNEMKSLLEEKNYHSLGMLAHKAKSSVSIMGMNDLAEMLRTFELQAKDGTDSELYGSYIDRFLYETKIAVTELGDLVNNPVKKSE